MNHLKIKDEIIKFVVDSPEDVNSRVAVFITGMQAQKNLMACSRKTENCPFVSNRRGLSDTKNGPEKG